MFCHSQQIFINFGTNSDIANILFNQLRNFIFKACVCITLCVSKMYTCTRKKLNIKCLPRIPHFYSRTWVYRGLHIFFLQNRLLVLFRTASARRFSRVPTICALSLLTVHVCSMVRNVILTN